MSEQTIMVSSPIDGNKIRKVWHDDEWWYSAVDMVAELTNSRTPRQSWNNLKRQVETESNRKLAGLQLKLPATDGRLRLTDVVNTEQALRIIQSIPSPKAEPMKLWLASVGAERLEETRDPEGYEERIIIEEKDDTEEARRKRRERRIAMHKAKGRDETWIATREFSIVTRLEFTFMIKELLGSRANYGLLTNDVYRGVHHRDTAKLRSDLGIKSGDNPRDHMHRIGLHYTAIAEEACQIKLSHLLDDEEVPPKLVREIIMIVSKQIGMQADELALALGIDIVTGKPLLPSQVATQQ
jgi:DNA-damage-inducible protein D